MATKQNLPPPLVELLPRFWWTFFGGIYKSEKQNKDSFPLFYLYSLFIFPSFFYLSLNIPSNSSLFLICFHKFPPPEYICLIICM